MTTGGETFPGLVVVGEGLVVDDDGLAMGDVVSVIDGDALAVVGVVETGVLLLEEQAAATSVNPAIAVAHNARLPRTGLSLASRRATTLGQGSSQPSQCHFTLLGVGVTHRRHHRDDKIFVEASDKSSGSRLRCSVATNSPELAEYTGSQTLQGGHAHG